MINFFYYSQDLSAIFARTIIAHYHYEDKRRMNDLKLLNTYGTQFEAELVKNRLEREGIEAAIESHDASGMFPSVDYADGVRVYVEPDDYEEAVAITTVSDENQLDNIDASETLAEE